VTGRWIERGLCLTGHVRSVFSIYACLSFLIERAARPVIVDRMRPVGLGAYWTLTGRWHCGVWSVLQRVRSLSRSSAAQAWPARPVHYGTSVSSRTSRVRSMRRACLVGASRRRLCAIGASGQLDQRIRLVRQQLFQVPNNSIRRGTSINTRWLAQSSISCIL
jgi:hypothetical protein